MGFQAFADSMPTAKLKGISQFALAPNFLLETQPKIVEGLPEVMFAVNAGRTQTVASMKTSKQPVLASETTSETLLQLGADQNVLEIQTVLLQPKLAGKTVV